MRAIRWFRDRHTGQEHAEVRFPDLAHVSNNDLSDALARIAAFHADDLTPYTYGVLLEANRRLRERRVEE